MAWPTNTDITTRLARDLTSDETAQADLLIDQAIALITAACDKTDDWADALDPVPAALASIVIEAVARAMSAPIGLRSSQETLGSYSHSESYPDQLAQGIALTAGEELRARRIVFGSSSGSSRPANVLDDLYDLDS